MPAESLSVLLPERVPAPANGGVAMEQAPGSGGGIDAPTLRSWRANRKAPSCEELKDVVAQLAAQLKKLHARGLGHFAIRPDTIHVRPGPTGPEFILGGLEATLRIDHGDLIPIAVDLLYCPPEAAGLSLHSPGFLLMAWDWWSLGRVLQEFILGQDVLMLVPESLYSNPPLSRSQLAENLLFERNVGALRTGAVELMPGLDENTKLLLHGLLTTAIEGRWGSTDVLEWLEGLRPPDRYESPRRQCFFRLDGRGYTPPEAAQILRGPKHFADMVSHVFGVGEPGKLAHFLQENQSKNNYFQLLEQSTRLLEADGLEKVPAESVREIAAALALTAISGGTFLWRGKPIVPALVQMLQDPEDFEQTRALLQAFITPAVLNLLRPNDPATAELLAVLITSAVDAEQQQIRCRLGQDDPRQSGAELWLQAMESDEKLASSLALLKQGYAVTTNPALDAMFSNRNPNRAIQVTLAWASRDPKRHGFKSHAELKKQRIAALTSDGRFLAQLQFWLRLGRALRASPLLFGGRWLLLSGGLAIVLLLAVNRAGPAGILLGLVPFSALALLRFALNRWQARLVRTWTSTGPWSWRDGVPRCEREALALSTLYGYPTTLAEVSSRLKGIMEDIRTLSGPGQAEPIPQPPRHYSSWSAALLSWLALGLVAALSVWQGVKHPPSWKIHASAWQHAFASAPPSAPTPVRPKPEKAEPVVDPRQSWPYTLRLDSPFPPVDMESKGEFTPTPQQAKAALEQARHLVEAYRPDTINASIALYIEQEDGQGGLLFFDGKKGSLKSPKGILVAFIPPAKTWLKIGNDYAFFFEK